MKKIINYYPTLTDEMMQEVFPSVKYSFSYEKIKGKEISLGHDESVGNNISLVLKDSDWNHNDYDLNLKMDVEVNSASKLYGKNGIAPKNSKIAMGMEVYSQKSRCRNLYTADELLDDDDKTYEYELGYLIEKNTFISDVDIHTFIYLKESSKKVDFDSKYLNNEEGIILGTIDHRRLFLIGTGSLFPIYVESLESNKLWTFDINVDNPEVDKFSDCSKLVFNKNHKDYKKLDPTDKSYCDRLVLEIISTSLFMAFTKLKEEGYLDNIQSSYADGSIMSLISYYKDALGINFTDVKSIFDSLQEYANKEYVNAI